MAKNVLIRGELVDGGNAKLEVFFTDSAAGGGLIDVNTLEFTISERESSPPTLTQTFPATGRQTVDVTALFPTGDKLGTGHYAARYTVPITQVLGEHVIKWFYKVTPTSPEKCFAEEFQVEAALSTPVGGAYCSIADIRDEGVPVADFSDSVVQNRILRVSRLVDMYTGRFFEPRSLQYTVSGQQSRVLFLDHPIISLTQLSIDGVVIAPVDLIVFNRHISESLVHPDDRENPRIELLQPVTGDLLFAIGIKVIPRGQLNILIDGVFGYTDPDGSPQGATPELICHAVKLMVMRELHPMFTGQDERASFGRSYAIKRLKTRDQEIEYADPAAVAGAGGRGVTGIGPFTGDPEIDAILMRYRRPMHIGSSSGGPLPGAYGF